ncbi:hypothetical protein [Maioricimonas sp. JC845]|uniref:hypothetical protein n=1 Tax=Maioricimonas sp. JC845 TaxID=3232138 RepID=UPI0034589DAF
MSSNGPCQRDANGNQPTIEVSPGDFTTNTWDLAHRLTRVEHSDGRAAGQLPVALRHTSPHPHPVPLRPDVDSVTLLAASR